MWQVVILCISILADTSRKVNHIMQTTAVVIKDCLTLHSDKLQSVLFDNWDRQETQAQIFALGALVALSRRPRAHPQGRQGPWQLLTPLNLRLQNQQDGTRLQAKGEPKEIVPSCLPYVTGNL